MMKIMAAVEPISVPFPGVVLACLLAGMATANPLSASPAPSSADTILEVRYHGPNAIVDEASFQRAFAVNEVATNQWRLGRAGIGGAGAATSPVGQNTTAVHRSGFPGFTKFQHITLTQDVQLAMRWSGDSPQSISFRTFLTTEADPAGTSYSLRILDEREYYVVHPDGSYLDDAGTGNVVDAHSPQSRRSRPNSSHTRQCTQFGWHPSQELTALC